MTAPNYSINTWKTTIRRMRHELESPLTTPQVKAFERGDQVGFDNVPGWVVLLDADMNEVVPRQECRFNWSLLRGGANFAVTTNHEFDILRKSISYTAVGAGDEVMFVSIVAGRPVDGSARMSIT